MLRSAAVRLPADERERWREEWLAEHAAKVDRPLTALLFAAQVRMDARAVAAELSASSETLVESADTPSERTAEILDKESLHEALELLSYRERRVLELRYGLGEESSRTLDEVARIFSVTPERIRQIEGQSLKKLQSLAEAQKLREVA